MRTVALMVFSVVLSTGVGVALGQGQPAAGTGSTAPSTPEPADEVVVRGKRLADLRIKVDRAQDHAYGIFNDINSTNDFDVTCRDEGRTGTRGTHRVCRPRFEGRISSAAAKEYIAALTMTCPAGADGAINFQACMFSGYGQRGMSRAQAIQGEAPGKRDLLSEEIQRLASENDQFAQSILDYYAAQQEYEAARRPKAKGD